MVDGYQRLDVPWPPTLSPSINYVPQVHFQSVLCCQHSASHKCIAPFDSNVHHENYVFLDMCHTSHVLKHITLGQPVWEFCFTPYTVKKIYCTPLIVRNVQELYSVVDHKL